ncbi:hypothetical protein BFP70_13355 [Thioclava sp. SK-1]|uniref:hypothetical protein n=1 Tax=Thioclava sp. SK-1 TaxID=1889770 RepID=UPI0008261B64|nr:hypothetical protein [Thioclava sp. SK-1]OCX62789.1 hypothetical protein BFP70_13355 [Thioclava sp. SK-1]
MIPVWFLAAAGLLLQATQSVASDFTSVEEVRPILAATHGSWVSIHEADGQDLVYFTQILSWRCPIAVLRYGLNGADPMTEFPMEPCHFDYSTPSVQFGDDIFIRQPGGSVQSIHIVIEYHDGSQDEAVLQRGAILSK